ncbi:outer membrane protein transport protein [Vibrio rumoiensis]|uniref:Long-chain fatty acid transporter n=1 Tax=Vibrio rumoiensis 1S-45 TaxID=1188252 RepID=A0A1E5E062_9VIBR|nr:outer membrane protein transport protein [Vibrio rumoiensis]OEF23680.1 long-chain fatty acid transporter [Vibrio rumoiensis 1S-45]
MKKLHVLTTSTITGALLLASQSVFAAGFQISAQSATGAGRAYAGDGIIGDNASVMAINPAAMALFDKTSFTMGATAIKPKISVKDGTYTSNVSPNSSGSVGYDDAGSLAVAPNMFLVIPLNEKFAVGAGLYSNFGTASSFDSSFPGEYGGESSIMSGELALAASYRLNEQWSFGAGLDLIYGIGQFARNLQIQGNPTVSITPNVNGNKFQQACSAYNIKTNSKNPSKWNNCDHTFSADRDANMADVDASGFGVGWNVGTTYELDENNRWGISYHASPKITATGDMDGTLKATGADELYVPLPDFAQFSGYNRIKGTKFALSYTIGWTDWSKFDKLTTNGTPSTLENFEWKDTWNFAIGGTYYLTDKWTLRTGYMFDQGAQDEVTTIAVPDSNRNWLSAGFSYAPSKDSSIDFGFTYLLGKDVDATQSYDHISSIEATTHTDAIITGVQYSKTF